MKLRALIFDVDGTLADTEEVHRRAFNAAFNEHGLSWDWTPELYGRLLEIGGGKERLLGYIESLQLLEAERRALEAAVPLIHATKTLIYAQRLRQGIALRPGVARLCAEAQAAGIELAIASTTTRDNIDALLVATLGPTAIQRFSAIVTGDAVARKKPAPDVYRLALFQLQLPADDCVAFEDSAIGLRSAQGANLFTVVTPSQWSKHQNLQAADLLLPSLGDPATPLPAEAAQQIGGARWLGIAELVRALEEGTAVQHAHG